MSRGRPFHFLAGWAEYPNFAAFVQSKWNFNRSMLDSLSNFTFSVKE